jgi:hypothetical protein
MADDVSALVVEQTAQGVEIMDNSGDDDHRKLFELEQELWRRRCRQDFTAFCVESLSAIGLRPAAHHRLICSRLALLADGEIDRLMILAPPGSAKTTYVSRLFPAWFFAFQPRANIIAASHTASLAEENSGHVQRIVRANGDVLGYGLRTSGTPHPAALTSPPASVARSAASVPISLSSMTPSSPTPRPNPRLFATPPGPGSPAIYRAA